MNLVVGAGLSGSVLAELIARVTGEEVLIIDAREHIGGNVYDEKVEGIFVHRYGPHIFHTRDKRVWDYVNRFGAFYPYIHQVRANLDGKKIPLPFSLKSLEMCFPQYLAREMIQKLLEYFAYGEKINVLELLSYPQFKPLANFIYTNIFKNYTQKQWGRKLEELDPSVASRVPFVLKYSDCYFEDCYQGIPYEGYSTLISHVLDCKRIKVALGESYCGLSENIVKKAKRIFYTGGIDGFFDYCFGKLEYRAVSFEFQTLQQDLFQEVAVINYPNHFDFTRITEYKHFLPCNTKEKTIISMEYPQPFDGTNEACYPIPNQEQQALYARYLHLAKSLKNVYFLGRLGAYRYLNMDEAIQEAMRMFDSVFSNGGSSPYPG